MDVREAIKTRRSIVRFRDEPVPAEQLLEILEAGIWAPNHHLTEPWRFVVIGPETQGVLAERYGELRAIKIPEDAEARRERVRLDSVAKFAELPNVVAVIVNQEGDDKRRREDYAAACCAIQNIQLAGWAEGVGMKWSTSILISDPVTFDLLGVDPEIEMIVGFLYIGYPGDITVRGRKQTIEDVTVWTS